MSSSGSCAGPPARNYSRPRFTVSPNCPRWPSPATSSSSAEGPWRFAFSPPPSPPATPARSSRWRPCAMNERPGAGAGGPQPGQAPTAGPAVLRACDLGKTYYLGKRPLEVLRQVNPEVGRGEFLAVRGASGAGKSTLLHLLGGLDAPSTGAVWFGNQNLAGLSAQELSRFRNRAESPARF